jgi:hypothetical protein
MVGREVVSVRHERSGRAVIGIGSGAQVIGLMLVLYAMDGLILSSSPHVNERPTGFRDDVRAPVPFERVPWSVRRSAE